MCTQKEMSQITFKESCHKVHPESDDRKYMQREMSENTPDFYMTENVFVYIH